MNNQKLIIIGAGAAGIMSAISAKKHHPKLEVTILEKNPVLGKKILICGAGRCNVTNSRVSINRFYGAPQKFISTILNQFNNQAIIEFLNGLGIELYEEEKNGRSKGKIFPITNQAKTVTELLESELNRLGINIRYNMEVTDIQKQQQEFQIYTANDEQLTANYLILACGGKTYPTLGATGFGYEIAKKFGHRIINPVPSALPLIIDHKLILRLAGLRIDAEITSIIDEKEVKTDTDELLFARYGLTGPVILNVSREISVRMNRENKKDCKLKINFFPGRNHDSFLSLMHERWSAKPNQKVLYSLYGLVPNQMANYLLDYLEINKDLPNDELSKEEKFKLAEFLTNWTVDVKATKGWAEAEFTAGGVDTKEIKTSLESKIIPNLYLAGEVLNVDGDVGGFNLSWAWSSGFVAGKLD